MFVEFFGLAVLIITFLLTMTSGNTGSDAQRGGSAMYNMIKGGKKFKKLKR
jgi:hypothetical protein